MTSAKLTVTQELNAAIDALEKIADVSPAEDDDAAQGAAYRALERVDNHVRSARDAIERALRLIQITRCELVAQVDNF